MSTKTNPRRSATRVRRALAVAASDRRTVRTVIDAKTIELFAVR